MYLESCSKGRFEGLKNKRTSGNHCAVMDGFELGMALGDSPVVVEVNWFRKVGYVLGCRHTRCRSAMAPPNVSDESGSRHIAIN